MQREIIATTFYDSIPKFKRSRSTRLYDETCWTIETTSSSLDMLNPWDSERSAQKFETNLYTTFLREATHVENLNGTTPQLRKITECLWFRKLKDFSLKTPFFLRKTNFRWRSFRKNRIFCWNGKKKQKRTIFLENFVFFFRAGYFLIIEMENDFCVFLVLHVDRAVCTFKRVWDANS